MSVERTGEPRSVRVVPRAGLQLHDAGAHRIGHDGACEAGAARVEDANHVAVRNPAGRRIARIDPERLAPLDLGGAADRAVVELAV